MNINPAPGTSILIIPPCKNIDVISLNIMFDLEIIFIRAKKRNDINSFERIIRAKINKV